MSEPAVVSVRALRKTWPGPVDALRGVDLEVAAGQIVTVLGANGSGKSTLLAILAGLIHPTHGEVHVLGAPWGDPAARARLGYLPEAPRMPPRHTPRGLLSVAARLSGAADDAVPTWLTRMGLAPVSGARIGTLSQGTRKRLALALALAHGPRLLLLDEPLGALDAPGRDVTLAALTEARARGATVLVTTHWPEPFAPLADATLRLTRGVLETA